MKTIIIDGHGWINAEDVGALQIDHRYELDHLKADIENYKHHMANQAKGVSGYMAKILKMELEAADQHATIKELNANQDGLEGYIESMEQLVADMHVEANDLKRGVAAFEAVIDVEQRRINDMERENWTLCSEVSDLAAAKDSLESHVQELEREVDYQSGLAAEYSGKLTKLYSRLADLSQGKL